MAMLMCRKCGRMAFVPYDAKPDVAAQCPHCGAEIPKRAPAEKEMPELLFDPGQGAEERQTSEEEADAFIPPGAAPGPKEAVRSEENKREPKLPSAQTKPEADEPWEAGPIVGDMGARSGATGDRAKVRRRKRNPAVELVKMVLGGIVGLAIGYGILLWGFRVDPFNLARYLPAAVVPESVKTP